MSKRTGPRDVQRQRKLRRRRLGRFNRIARFTKNTLEAMRVAEPELYWRNVRKYHEGRWTDADRLLVRAKFAAITAIHPHRRIRNAGERARRGGSKMCP
jgi:hypothetical protein